MEDIRSASPASQQLSPALAPGGSFHGPTSTREREAGVFMSEELARKIKREKGRLRMAAWRKANPEKNRAAQRARYRANPEKARAKSRKWCRANPEKVRALRAKNGRAWRAANPEKKRAKAAAWYARNAEKVRARTAAWRRANPERARAAVSDWVKANPDRRRIISVRGVKKRRARAAGALVGGSETFIDQFYITARRISNCLKIPFHVDHIRPLSKGGAHHESNLQVIPGHLNMKKHAKTDFLFP